ncbi:hypothetical protein [Rhodococcus sp. 66b]|uniref:hypothetical protein n=1 Tax=Rhodococcus sp. 66b TaxID=1945511 RepID=UPI0009BAA1E4|nr:hypothetical protein [Rhodococcus sp. 66b]OQM77854.1 hypothetical protein B0E55_06262 [Rhodococcus sp. 66b]
MDWDKIGKDDFERIVETLLTRKWQGIATVTCPDGRGGDGGIDVEVRQSDRRRIHQLKYFPDGFSGDKKTTRHKQIRNSFERATKLSPPPSEWILVIPAKLTPGERTFVEGLGGPDRPPVTILDRVGLDVLIAEFPDVYRYLRRDHLRPEVELYRLETETLTGNSKPLTRRILDLGAQADSTDLFWATDFSRVGDKVTYTVRPKDTDAHKKSPITVSFDSVFGPEHDDVRRKFEQSMNFGASGAIVLPPHVVNNMVIRGPQAIAGTPGNVTVRMEPLNDNPAVGEFVELRFFGTDGTLRSAHEGRITYINHGSVGYSLEISFYEHLEVELLAPISTGGSGESRLSYNFHRIRPKDALAVLDLLDSLRSPGIFKVYIKDDFLASHQTNGEPTDPALEQELAEIYGIALDLSVVQEFCNHSFAIPEEITPWERVNLRVARIIIDGHLTASPRITNWTAPLSGLDSPKLRTQLTESGPAHFTWKDFTLKLGSKELALGDAGVIHGSAKVVNSEEALAALDAGTARGFRIKFEPQEDRYFLIYLLGQGPELKDRMIAKWTLPGFTQPGTEKTNRN